MEKKKKLRKRYARTVVSNAIEARITGIRDTSTLNSFLYLIDRFRPWIDSIASLESGRAGCLSVESVCKALQEVSAANRYWVRHASDWESSGGVSFRVAFASLIRHLMATHEVPSFLDHVWWTDHSNAGQHRKWFRHIARGHSVRGIVEARLKSKTAARRFMESPAHFTVEQALAWAKNRAITPQQKQNFGLTRRREKRLIAGNTAILWKRINVNDFCLTELRHDILNMWRIRQIRDKKNLKMEGRAMCHCVSSYAGFCEKGKTTIWSMTRKIF